MTRCRWVSPSRRFEGTWSLRLSRVYGSEGTRFVRDVGRHIPAGMTSHFSHCHMFGTWRPFRFVKVACHSDLPNAPWPTYATCMQDRHRTWPLCSSEKLRHSSVLPNIDCSLLRHTNICFNGRLSLHLKEIRTRFLGEARSLVTIPTELPRTQVNSLSSAVDDIATKFRVLPWNAKDHYSGQTTSPLVPVLSQMNPVNILQRVPRKVCQNASYSMPLLWSSIRTAVTMRVLSYCRHKARCVSDNDDTRNKDSDYVR